MPPVLALGAIAAFGFLAIRAFQAFAEDQAKQEVFRAANGWSLDELANELTSDFDRDRDGRLAWNAVQGVRLLGESARTTTRTWTEPLPTWGAPAGTRAVRERRTMYSIEPLLRKADTDGDGVATRAELIQALRAYDADGNGRATAAEKTRALADLGAVRVSEDTRTVGILPPVQKAAAKRP